MKQFIKSKIVLGIFFVFVSTVFAQHSAYWKQKSNMYSVLPNTPNEIIFLGDSITDRCEWFELFSNPNVKNRGLSGDKTDGVLDRLSGIIESKPAKVFIMIGVNDIRHNVNDSIIVANYYKIVEKIKSESPNSKIYLQSSLPVNNDIGNPKTTNSKVNELNSSIKEIASSFNISFIDINSKLQNSAGQLDAKYSEDGLHINGKAYLVWKSVVEQYVNE